MTLTAGEIQVILPILGTAATAIMGYAIRFLVSKVGIAKLERAKKFLDAHKQLGRIAVLFAQEAYGDLSGRARFDIASEYLSGQLKNLGFTVDKSHVEAIILSSLKEAKVEFGDAWKKSVDSKQVVISEEDQAQTGK